MKKLFMIRLKNGKLLRDDNKKPVAYGNKMYAKLQRDKHDGATITVGPDHYKW